jgi:RNA polymerase-binding protein DksA
MKETPMPAIDHYKQQLQQLRQEYIRRHEAVEKDLQHENEPIEKDFAEQATQLENEQVLQALDEDALGIVAQIDTALRRIENGSYGICTACGETIAESRLQAVPYTNLCIGCANKMDH